MRAGIEDCLCELKDQRGIPLPFDAIDASWRAASRLRCAWWTHWIQARAS